MPFDTTCPHCGRVHDGMPDSATGSMVRCRGCFKPFTALALASARGEPEGEAVAEGRPGEVTPERAVPDGGSELRAVVARLADIQRKCGALVKRHPELVELEPTLEAVLRDLRLGHGPRGEPLALRELALPFGSWERRLHRLGLPVLGRELEHVERALIEASADRIPERPVERTGGDGEQASAAGIRTGSAARPGVVAPPPEPRRRLPVALALGGAAVLAVAGLGTVTVLRQPATSPQQTATVRQPAATPTLATPTPRPTPEPKTPERSALELSRLVEAASQAQLAAQRGELDRAVDHLEAAARVDPSRAEVRAAAQAVVDEMASRAGRDEGEGRFGEAEEQLLEAQRLSGRFLLDSTTLDAHLQRLRSAERTVRVRPTERDRLTAAVGRQVEVWMVGREVREGTLTGVEEGALVLEVHDQVGAGEVAYTVRVPTAKVDLVVYRYRP